MRHLLFRTIFLSLVLVVTAQAGFSQLSETRTPTSTTGVSVIEIEDPAGPWSLRVVEWNRNLAPELRLIPAKGAVEATERVAALETTSSIADRNGANYKQVIAAVNADFFSRRGEPVNRMKLDGEWILSHPDNPRRSVLTIDEKQQLWAGQTTLSTNLCRKSPGIYPPCVPVQWNRSPVPGSASILNHWFSDTLSNNHNNRVFNIRADKETDLMSATHGTVEFELAVERSQDLLVDTYTASLTATPRLDKGDRLVILNGDFWDDFMTRDTLSIETIINGPLTLPHQLIGGGPLLLRDGRMVVDSMATAEGILESFLTTRHPRTAIAWNADQTIVWLVVVDGRQEHSAGMSLHELSQFFLKLGASDALNLDGGGSSAIVADGKVLNSPSDPIGERRVTNALLLVR
jgi:hypothetical protein